MANRKFQDRQGDGWEVRAEGSREWRLDPLEGNDQMPRKVTPPGHTDDPFELSEKELQRMLDGGQPAQGKARKPPPFREE